MVPMYASEINLSVRLPQASSSSVSFRLHASVSTFRASRVVPGSRGLCFLSFASSPSSPLEPRTEFQFDIVYCNHWTSVSSELIKLYILSVDADGCTQHSVCDVALLVSLRPYYCQTANSCILCRPSRVRKSREYGARTSLASDFLVERCDYHYLRMSAGLAPVLDLQGQENEDEVTVGISTL